MTLPIDKLQSTPRTDAFFEEVGTMGPITHNVRWQDFARQLERELADEKRLNAGLIEGISAHKAELAKLQQSARAAGVRRQMDVHLAQPWQRAL
jgi:hypothetical protein